MSILELAGKTDAQVCALVARPCGPPRSRAGSCAGGCSAQVWVKQLNIYPICKSYQLCRENGVHAAFSVEECWDQPGSSIPKLNTLSENNIYWHWRECGTPDQVLIVLITYHKLLSCHSTIAGLKISWWSLCTVKAQSHFLTEESSNIPPLGVCVEVPALICPLSLVWVSDINL